LLAQRILDFPLLVGYHKVAHHFECMRLKEVGHHPAGHIHPFSQETGITHGNDNGTHHKQ
jgi:hypothetical protein